MIGRRFSLFLFFCCIEKKGNDFYHFLFANFRNCPLSFFTVKKKNRRENIEDGISRMLFLLNKIYQIALANESHSSWCDTERAINRISYFFCLLFFPFYLMFQSSFFHFFLIWFPHFVSTFAFFQQCIGYRLFE